MNNEALASTKKIHDALKDLMSNPYLQMSLIKKMPNTEMKVEDLLFLDSLRLMLYVASSDEKISQKELNVINYITGKYMDLETVQNIIDEDKDFYIYSMPEVPFTISVLCEVENALVKSNNSLDQSILNIAITYFSAIGICVAESDLDISRKEGSRITEYIDLIKEYADSNTLSPFYKN